MRLVARAEVEDASAAAAVACSRCGTPRRPRTSSRRPARRAAGCRSARRTSPPRRGRTSRRAPSAIGCDGSTTHSRSRRPSSRHLRSHDVPISRLKIFEKWPECRTIRPMPSSTRAWTRSTIGVRDLVVRHVAPPGQDVGLGEHRVAEAVVRLVQGRGPDLEAVRARAGRPRSRHGSRPDRSPATPRPSGPGGTRSRR